MFLVIKNQLKNQTIIDIDYTKYLESDIASKTFKQAQQNIREFYALQEINQDMISHLYLFEGKMYRLTSTQSIISSVLYCT